MAALGFFLHSVPLLFVALGLFGIVAALFGPVKYGILPEKLETAELPAGNALVEGATFLAILHRHHCRRHRRGRGAERRASSCCVILALAVSSWLFARLFPPPARPRPTSPSPAIPGRRRWRCCASCRARRRLWGGAHIVSWFWLVGFVALSLLPALVKDSIGGNESVVTLCLAVFTVGIAVGSVLAARASHGQPNLAWSRWAPC